MKKIKVIGILLFALFSFYYTDKVSSIIKKNDPIMSGINNVKNDMVVNKIDPIIMNDEYVVGLNGCVVDEEESYKKMKEVGSFKEELLVMKEDEIEDTTNKYIVGGCKNKRNISIIFIDLLNDKLTKYIEDNHIKTNYFLDAEYISNNISKLMELNKVSRIYNYGRNKEYLSRYIKYDNALINSNFNNKSSYCLVVDKNEDTLNLCSLNRMKVIKPVVIKDANEIKNNIFNGKILLIDSKEYDKIEYSINYILSKGYNIVYLDELLSTNNSCN